MNLETRRKIKHRRREERIAKGYKRRWRRFNKNNNKSIVLGDF
jgi:hypothetical protein